MAKADSQLSDWRSNLARGAAIARDEGELEGTPPAWLARYMDGQEQPPRGLIAARTPVGATLVGGR